MTTTTAPQNFLTAIEKIARLVPHIELREEEPDAFGHGHIVLYNETTTARLAFTEICDRPSDDPDREVTGYRWHAVHDDEEGNTITTLEGQAAAYNLDDIVQAAWTWATIPPPNNPDRL